MGCRVIGQGSLVWLLSPQSGGRPFACFLHQLFHKQQMVAVVEAQLSGHEQVQVQ
jgi:hypothetical protein